MRHNYSQKNTKQPQGFTLIELLFAMTAFSIMLVVAVSGLINAMAIYNQANVSRDNQQQVRSIVEQIGRDIRSASKAVVFADGTLCLEGTTDGGVRYYQGDPSSPNHLMRIKITNLDQCEVRDVNSFTYDLSSKKDLMSGGSVTKVSVFQAAIIQQSSTDPKVESVTITFGMVRGTGSSVRERQFGNQYKLTSAFMVGVQ